MHTPNACKFNEPAMIWSENKIKTKVKLRKRYQVENEVADTAELEVQCSPCPWRSLSSSSREKYTVLAVEVEDAAVDVAREARPERLADGAHGGHANIVVVEVI